ncbi:MAG: MBL fold metallo-hydrolase [Deltaproteobacteria bacterium]|nr:MBL fold metallo-hydrolase [Deltaproteobacteria bacterium]
MKVVTEKRRHPLPDGEVTVHGAVRSVTGAMLEARLGGARILIDCGVAQGRDREGWSFPESVAGVDAVVLTHGHNDHVGSLPELMALGYAGPIFATRATLQITRVVVTDSLRLQRRRNEVRPFEEWFAARSRPVAHDAWTELPGGEARLALREAGHILGSASVELRSSASRVIVSGDLGRPDVPILRDPNTTWDDDVPVNLVLMESTYGDRRHRAIPDEVEEDLLEIVRKVEAARGRLLVPAFAIGRTQLLLYHLNSLHEAGRIGPMLVALDSPMGIEITELHQAHRRLFDREALDRLHRGDDPLDFDGLYGVRRAEDSRRLREEPGPMVVIAGSGMCTGGRIVGHLVEHLDDASTTVLFVGYQAAGTPGRRIQEAAAQKGWIRLEGREVLVRARIATLEGLSAHADQAELQAWLAAIPGVERVGLYHGDPGAQAALAGLLSPG